MKRFFILLAVLCTVFSLSAAASAEWQLTEHADWSGNQSMFYTLRNTEDGYLIVVDGGWDINAEHVAGVVRDLGGTVNAWFISHYHADHANAFNVIYPTINTGEGIWVERVYDSPMDLAQYLEVGKDWDNLDVIVRYYEQTAGDELITHLRRDEVLDLDGMKVTVLNTYDELTCEVGDIPNNAALVLKMQTGEDTLLFMSDVHSEYMSNLMMERYGSALKADIFQSGHHGNNSYNYAIYEDVSPSVILFDGPEWLMVGETYKAFTLIKYCQENGIGHADFRTAPNVLAIGTDNDLRVPSVLTLKVSEQLTILPWEKNQRGLYCSFGTSDPGVAVITETGTLQAIAAGSTTITVMDAVGNTAQIRVIVQ